MKERDELEDLFRERFSEKEAPVSPRVWDKIKSTLPPEPKQQNYFWKKPFLFSGLLIGTIVAGFVAWWIISKSTQESRQSTRSQESVASYDKNKDLTQNQNLITKPGSENNKENTDNSSQKDSRPTRSDLSATSTLPLENDPLQDPFKSSTSSQSQSSPKEQSVKKGKKERATQNTDKNSFTSYQKETNTGISDRSLTTRMDIGQKKNTSDAKASLKNNTLDKGKTEASKDHSGTTVNKVGIEENERTVLSQPVSMVDNRSEKKSIATTNYPKSNNDLLKDTTSIETSPKDESKIKEDDTPNKGVKQEEQLVANAMQQSTKKQGFSNDPAVHMAHQTTESDKVKEKFSGNGLGNKNDSVANPTVAKALADTVKPVVDTLAKALVDSTALEDSTTKKEKEKIVKSSRWSMDLLAGPMATGASTKATDLAYKDIVEAKNEQDKMQLNASAGVMVNYSFSSKFHISTGILYSGYSEKYNFRHTKDSIIISSRLELDSFKVGQDTNYTYFQKTVYDTSSTTKEYSDNKKDQYRFISIPLNVSFYLWRRERLAVLASAGIRANVGIKSTTYLTNNDFNLLREFQATTQKVTLSYMASIALEYKLKNKLYLLIQPTVNYQGSSVYAKSSAISQKPYAVGVNVGLRLKF